MQQTIKIKIMRFRRDIGQSVEQRHKQIITKSFTQTQSFTVQNIHLSIHL